MTLAHDEGGIGPAVLLLHAMACDRRMWDPQLPALVEAGYRVVRCDLPGFGQTPLPDGPYRNADEVRDLLDVLGLDQVALVGASGGGRVALQVAALWPERVAALALLCTGAPGHEPSPELAAFGRREDELLAAGDVAGATELNLDVWLGPDADEQAREKLRQMQQHAFEVQLAASDQAEELPAEVDLAAITAPALLVSGAFDLVDFRQIAAELSGQLADARLLELPWAGHLPSMERPDIVTQLLTEFLAATLPPLPDVTS